jgi:hypothetical protein
MGDNIRKFHLKRLDALQHDLVWWEAAHSFHVVEKARGDGIVIEWLALLFWAAVKVQILFINGPGRC